MAAYIRTLKSEEGEQILPRTVAPAVLMRDGETTVEEAMEKTVPKTRKINHKALSDDVTLTAADVGAVPTSRKVNGKTLSSDITLAASDVGAVPTSRTVNGHALNANVTLTAADVSAVPTARKVNGKALSSDVTLAAADVSAVPVTRKVNNKALSTDITLFASDVGAVPTSRTVNGKALSGNITLSAADVGAVPTARTVNGKALSSNISLSAADVGAVPTARTVNGKALSSNISLAAADVGAVPTSRIINGKYLSSNVTLTPFDVAAASRPNLLRNANWSDSTAIINQRGNTTYTGNNIWSVDQWKLTGPNCTLQIHPGYLACTLGSNSNFAQFVEGNFAGKQMTASMLFQSVGVSGLKLAIRKADNWETIGSASIFTSTLLTSVTVTVPSSYTGNLIVTVLDPSERASWAFSAVAAKLEFGNSQTLAHGSGSVWYLNDPPPDRSIELLKCQRYFYRLETKGSDIWSPLTSAGVFYSDADARFSLNFPVEMRTNPIISEWAGVRCNLGESDLGCPIGWINCNGTKDCSVYACGCSGGARGKTVFLQCDNNAGGHIDFYAEL